MDRLDKQKIYSAVSNFFVLFFGTAIFLGGLTAGLVFSVFYIENTTYGAYFICLYLAVSAGFYIWLKNRKSITRTNFFYALVKVKSISGSIIKFVGYFVLCTMGIGAIFLIGGWVVSLSATTIIIILLVLILLK